MKVVRIIFFSAIFILLIVGGLFFFLPHLHKAKASGPTTWYIRPDGGTRYDANVPTGQCNGQADAPYPGTGVNQPCAFNDFRYMWDDDSGTVGAGAWVMAGGDTVIIRGCTALPGQQNPSNPDCRIGWDGPTGPTSDGWCYGVGSYSCSNPTIPAGTPSDPTRILGQNYANCAPAGQTNPKNYESRLTQLFAGFSNGEVLNLANTQNVELECLELTNHNGVCVTAGGPSYPRACNRDQPLDDYAYQGIGTNNMTSNITLQDLYIHGLDASGLYGPIGGPITMTRMFIGFNAFSAWNFDDGRDTPDGPGASINANYVIMEGNGCYEQYPIVNSFPAQVCYDTQSQGFGDSWSGQDTILNSFICNHCDMLYNTKDGFIGPHTAVTTLVIENSESIANMGQDWKWGGGSAVNTNITFVNNLTVGNCSRMSQPLPGAPSTYNQYLGGFCRAAGNLVASDIPPSSTWTIANNTWITYQPTTFDIACSVAPCPSTVNLINNIFLGYDDPTNIYGPLIPALFYIEDPEITINSSHNIEYGLRNGDCPTGGTGNICSDPLFVNEPQGNEASFAESELDNFNFTLAPGSPAIGAGIPVAGLSTDFNGNSYGNPPSIGAFEYGSNGAITLLSGSSGGGGGSPPPSSPPADTTPPSVPTNLSVSSVTASSISLSWTASTDNVGVTGYNIYRGGTKIGTTNTTSYTSTGLSASTAYSYTVSAYDAASNASAQSGSVSGTTSGGATTNPTGPSGYTFCANENGTCSFSGSMKVAFGVGSSFNYLTLTNGTPCTDAIFTDPAVGVVKACFTEPLADTTPPITSITSPTNNALESGTITVSASASDNVGVTSVALYVDGSLAGTDNTAPYTFSLNTTNLANGTHTIATKAYDAAGNGGISGNLTISVSNTVPVTAPVTTPSAPSGGGTTSVTPAPSFAITSVSISGVTPSTANITVTTHAPASVIVRYGMTTSYGMTTQASPYLGTNYVNLTNLTPNTVYDFIVIATPAGGTSIASPVYTLKTTAQSTVLSSASPSSPASTPTFTENLAYGDTNAEVTLLQTILHTQGFLSTSVPTTGYFGVATEHALLLFQSAHNLNKSGFVDLQTETLLNKIATAGSTPSAAGSITPTTTTGATLTRNLAPGSTGPDVTTLQHLLNHDGDYPSALYTEYYGSLTEAAVRIFQTKYGIATHGSPSTTGYGAVGPKTRVKLGTL